MKAAKRLSQLPVLNEEAGKLEGRGMEHSQAWESLQERWKNDGKIYAVKSQSGKFYRCELCDDVIPDTIYTIVNNKIKKSLDIPYSVVHFIDEHPDKYIEEPVYKGALPKSSVFEAMGKKKWLW